MVFLTHEPIDYTALTERVRSKAAGAVVLFLGTVRELTDGRQTVALDYEAYPEMAEAKMQELEAAVRQKWTVVDSAIIHRLGRLELSEISVGIAVSCPHRQQAFEACRYLIDEFKQIVPIWKKENWADGSSEWIHPSGKRARKEAETVAEQLIDRFGRIHTNLRISVTDRCNIRCFYCMPAENVQFMDREDLLTFEEIERFVQIAVPLGLTKIRLTGGEPLVRNDLHVLVRKLADIPQIQDIGLTTNGILLADQAQALYNAGLRRINVSLDALDPLKFKQITRRDGYQKVIQGIQAAQRVGFDPVKVNAVAVRGLTEDEIVPFGHMARETGVEIRFIEFMPLDADNAWEREKVLFAHEIIEKLSTDIMPLVPCPDQDSHAPATAFQFADGRGKIGIIASISQPFCLSCDRFRVTADGKLRNCLFSLQETDVRVLLRGSRPDAEIAQAIRDSIAAKQEGHEINTARFIQPDRPMYSIGG